MTTNLAQPHEHHAEWRLEATERLVGVVQELSRARTLDEVTSIVRRAARALTGADGATFVLRDGDQCHYADEDALEPLWKGRRFPMKACISGWVMLNARPAVIENIYTDPRVPAEAYRPTFVKSLAMVPIRQSAPIGAIGNYWATRRAPSEGEVAILQALADTTSVAMENVELIGQLRSQVHTLSEQREQIEQQRETLEVFTRAMAHDLKEPVRTMRSFAELALGSAENRERNIRFVRDAAERMGTLIDTVLRYMLLDDPTAIADERVDMQEVMAAVAGNLASLAAERHAKIEHGVLPIVQGQHVHLTQVVQNLVCNAILHNDPGVIVSVRAFDHAGDWLFSVEDNGRGIPPGYKDEVFEAFKKLDPRPGSVGLGLSLCRKIVAKYGGMMWCESPPERGATFFFTWPRAVLAPGKQETTAPTLSVRAADPLACMLLVDDGPDDLVLTRMMLARKARLQCRLLTAENGEEALDVLSREPIDVVLLDINMPRMNGFEALERMRGDAAMRNVPVIICSGSEYEKDRARAHELGAVGYIVKPPKFKDLRAMIERIPSLRLSAEDGNLALRRVERAAAA